MGAVVVEELHVHIQQKNERMLQNLVHFFLINIRKSLIEIKFT